MSNNRVKVKKGLGLINREVSSSAAEVCDDCKAVLERLCVAARKEVARGNYKRGGELYADIARQYPECAEARFYIAYCDAWYVEIDAKGVSAYTLKMRSCLEETLDRLAKNHEPGAKEAAAREIVTQLYRVNRVIFERAHKAWAAEYDFRLLSGVQDSATLMFYLGDRLEAAFPNNSHICLEAARAWKYGLLLFHEIKLNTDESKTYTPKIHKYDPEYDPNSVSAKKGLLGLLGLGPRI